MTLEAVYRAARPRLVRGLQRRYGAEAEDAVQEAFIRALSTTGVGQGWVWVTARNVARDTYRGMVRTDRRHRSLPHATSTTAPVEAVLTVHAVLQQLPPKQREVVELFDLQGHSGEEIAARLGVPLSTVRTRLHYARKEMARRVA